jgi:FkbH-like protein
VTDHYAGFLYGAPIDLSVTKTGLKNVLVIGSCLISSMPDFIRQNNPDCESDYILFNNGVELPATPPRALDEYDFQIIQIGTRSVLQERDYFRLNYDDGAAYDALFETVKENLSRLMETTLRYNIESGLLTIFTNFLVPQQNAMGRLQPRYDLRNPVHFFEELNKFISEEVKKYRNVFVFDIDLLARQFGKKFVQDDAVWSLAHNAVLSDYDYEYDQQRIQPVRAMSEIYQLRLYDFVRSMWAEIVALYRTARQIDTIKLVVVDLDDTIWRGVLADESSISWNAIEGWPLGFIEALLYLKRRGIMLAIISKNDEKIVERIWNQLFRGLLAMDDFAVRKINWFSKAENLLQILKEVNVLSRSVLYIDDNPVEREIIHDAFPDVRLLGANPYILKRILLWAPETQVPFISEESVRHTEMIQQQVERETVRERMSRKEFLASLNLRITARRIEEEIDSGFSRALELINKTNQYNSTGRRWKIEDVRQSFAAGGYWYTFEVEDRFSHYGVVAVAIVQGQDIVQFVMSCRVVGLDVEVAAVAVVAAEIFKSGVGAAHGHIVKTDANFLVRNLFQSAGFTGQGDVWIGTPDQICVAPDYVQVIKQIPESRPPPNFLASLNT